MHPFGIVEFLRQYSSPGKAEFSVVKLQKKLAEGVGMCDNVEINRNSEVSADKVYRTVNLNVEFL